MSEVGRQVGSAIQDMRLSLGLSQQALADDLNRSAALTRGGHKWTQSMVSKIEHASRPVTVEEVVAIADALFCGPGALMAGCVKQQDADELRAEVSRLNAVIANAKAALS